MLETKMMYYPFVHPPRSVLWQALLYWDELTSITPEGGYEIGPELEVLQDHGLYRPTYVDALPGPANRALVDDMRQVVAELPDRDLIPVPGPLRANNRLHWGKLPYQVQDELLAKGALIPRDDMLLASPVLLSQLMVVLAKHLAAATRGTIPFTESPSAQHVAFAPLGQPNVPAWPCWQVQIGQFLPVPADDAPLEKVLAFRELYADEREELAKAVGRLLLRLSAMETSSGADPDQAREWIDEAVRQIKKAAGQLEKAGHGDNIVWLKRGLLVLGGLGIAGASVFAPPVLAAMLVALSGVGIGFVPTVTRPGVTPGYTYLQELSTDFDTAWPSPAAT
jgi:Family of unknown function (DUF6236)